jgi:lipopolysaccharide/colanic/teichoic acid biosynthesis glycosyltransferase
MIKRLFDIAISIFAFILLLPVMLITSAVVMFNFGAPVFFTQIRPGYQGKPFKIYKFRTMSNRTDLYGNSLPDCERLTKFGMALRASSIDELPALWNVLMGDMSLVGPRPLLMEYLPLYNKSQQRRHHVKPGITGWAQVNGRNAISWQEKFDLDVWYVENQSFWLDLKILLMTVKKVIIKDGISGGGEVTMSKFTGNNK